mmetsp:Transcript_94623/g.244354  ORF Transcript_94623/g.244354 Transcript_94623/m.244354 type:complete len:234 (+) Transcript_94623:1787-2488(+)
MPEAGAYTRLTPGFASMVLYVVAPPAYQCLSSSTRAVQREPSGKHIQNLPNCRSSRRRSVSARSSASRSRRFFLGFLVLLAAGSTSSSSSGGRPCAARALASSSFCLAASSAAKRSASSASLCARSASSRAFRSAPAVSAHASSVKMPKVMPPLRMCVHCSSRRGLSGLVKLSICSGMSVAPRLSSPPPTLESGVTPSKARGSGKVSLRPRCRTVRRSREPSDGTRIFSTTLQ